MNLRFWSSVVGFLVGAAAFCFTPASAGCVWQVFKPANPVPNAAYLVAVTSITANDVWALGFSGGVEFQHFDGKSWSLVPRPVVLTPQSALYDMRAASSTNIWAVGYQYLPSVGVVPLIVHWDGTSWKVVPSPAVSGSLDSVAPIGNTYVWAAGEAYPKPLIEHFDGQTWVVDRSYVPPGGASLTQAITGTSLTDIWAGGYYDRGALIEHWDRRTHSWIQSRSATGNYIDSMSARSSTEVWAVGPPSPGAQFVERWDGRVWNSISYPRGSDANAVIAQVDATATRYTWFVGHIHLATNVFSGFVDRYGGQWRDMGVSQVGSLGTRLNSISPVPHSADVWVVGEYDNSPSSYGNLAERYTCT